MAAKKERRERTIWEDKVIGGPLWATLVGALVAAMVVSFFVFVQSGEAAPPQGQPMSNLLPPP
jgi:hypothetical protein